jgi:hypothetical protein
MANQGFTPGGQPGYEFSKSENATIGHLTTWLKALVGVMGLTGLVHLAQGNILSVPIDIALAVLLFGAAESFGKIVTTQGNDVGHLMQALDKFSNVLLIRSILAVLLFVLAIGGALLAMSMIMALKR